MANQKVYTFYFRKKRKYDANGELIEYDEITDQLPEDLFDKHLTIIIDYNDIYEYIPNQYHEFIIDFYNDNISNDKSIIRDFELWGKKFREYSKSDTMDFSFNSLLDSYEELSDENLSNDDLSYYLNPESETSYTGEDIQNSNFKIYNNIYDYQNDYVDDIDNIYREYQVDEKRKLFYIPQTKYEEVVEGVNRYLDGQLYILEVVLNKLPNEWSYAIDKEERLAENDFFYTLNDIKNQLNRLEEE